MTASTIRARVNDHDELIELEFDPACADSLVWYRYPEIDPDEWRDSPFRAVELRHMTDAQACAKVDAWVG